MRIQNPALALTSSLMMQNTYHEAAEKLDPFSPRLRALENRLIAALRWMHTLPSDFSHQIYQTVVLVLFKLVDHKRTVDDAALKQLRKEAAKSPR